jgi:hypothetical protein
VRDQNLGNISKLSAGQRQVDSVRATLKSGENPAKSVSGSRLMFIHIFAVRSPWGCIRTSFNER